MLFTNFQGKEGEYMDEKKSLRYRLQEYHLSYSWLIDMMGKKGMEVDKSTLSSAVNGTIKGERVGKILEMAHSVLDEYEAKYLRSMSP